MISMFDFFVEKSLCYLTVQIDPSLDHEYSSLQMHLSFSKLVEETVFGILSHFMQI